MGLTVDDRRRLVRRAEREAEVTSVVAALQQATSQISQLTSAYQTAEHKWRSDAAALRGKVTTASLLAVSCWLTRAACLPESVN